MSRLRVACVGSGFIAGRHLAALSGFPDVEIVAVAAAGTAACPSADAAGTSSAVTVSTSPARCRARSKMWVVCSSTCPPDAARRDHQGGGGVRSSQ